MGSLEVPLLFLLLSSNWPGNNSYLNSATGPTNGVFDKSVNWPISVCLWTIFTPTLATLSRGVLSWFLRRQPSGGQPDCLSIWWTLCSKMIKFFKTNNTQLHRNSNRLRGLSYKLMKPDNISKECTCLCVVSYSYKLIKIVLAILCLCV